MTKIAELFSSVISNNTKVNKLENSLQQSLTDFTELLVDFEQLHITSDNYKVQLMERIEKCESKCCSGAQVLKKDLEAKEYIIQAAASSLTRLNETKNFSIIDEIFKILFGEAAITTPPNQKLLQNTLKPERSPENVSFNGDVTFKDESVSEIEGTPTGRTSPIIQMKKVKTSISNASDYRDKKKCPDTWTTPENKCLKLSFFTPTRGKGAGKSRQTRLNVVRVKETNVIDITSSPEFNGGSRRSENDTQTIVKKESLDNDETIMPSPTSAPSSFTLFKSKESPMKFKKPLSLKSKSENNSKNKSKVDPNHKLVTEPTLNQLVHVKTEKLSQNIIENNTKEDINVKMNDSPTYTQDNSINILNPMRLPQNLIKSPTKVEPHEDSTFCDTQASVSLLQQGNTLALRGKANSPTKRPLAENINVTNAQDDLESSMSLLQREAKPIAIKMENVKRRVPEPVQVIYKEELPRTRAERRLLPGWACEKCVNFFSELYKDDPEMMAKKINACSHHRGNQNPERPKTPPNYWNPRWEVPTDTEEFNRRNNVNN